MSNEFNDGYEKGYKKGYTDGERAGLDYSQEERDIEQFCRGRENGRTQGIKDFAGKLKEKALTLSPIENYHIYNLIDETLKEAESNERGMDN